MCLSPKKALGRCYECDHFWRSLLRHRDVEAAINSMECNPRIPEEVRPLLQEYVDTLDRLRELRQEIREFGKEKNVAVVGVGDLF